MSFQVTTLMPSRTSTIRPALFTAVGLLLATGASGCGRSTCTVSGRVFLDDQPVTAGSIALYCDGEQTLRGHIGPNGTYSIPNVPLGQVRVTVFPIPKMPLGHARKYTSPPVVNDGPIIPKPERTSSDSKSPVIPKRYSVPEESGLAFRVDHVATTFDIHLSR